MKQVESEAFLRVLQGTVVHGTLPAQISRVVGHPDELTRPGDVWFDRWGRMKQIQKYGPGIVVTGQDFSFETRRTEAVVIKVPDCEEAYWNFIDFYRSQFNIPVIAVTGTCGKTTTKEMIKHLLSHRYRVQATIRSKNASSYHQSYLLGIEEDTQMAVFETGVSKPGDIMEASRYYRPTLGVITNIGIDHLNNFSTHRDYIEAKGEMLPGVGDSGTVVLNADDANIASIDKSTYGGRIVTFGFQAGADYLAKDCRVTTRGGLNFTLVHQSRSYRLFVPGQGQHTVYNALAAIAAVHQLGIRIPEAGARLQSYQHLAGHLTILPGLCGSVLIDDTWNSNPTSMQSAIQVLCELAGQRKKIAILGRMAALGDYADEQYERIAEKLVASGIDILIAKGAIASAFAEHAVRLGMPPDHVFTCTEVEEVVAVMRQVVDANSITLVKASMNDEYTSDLIRLLTEKR